MCAMYCVLAIVTCGYNQTTLFTTASYVLNGAIGRTFARTKDERLLRARICSHW